MAKYTCGACGNNHVLAFEEDKCWKAIDAEFTPALNTKRTP